LWWCYGVTKDPSEGNYLLVFDYNVLNNLSETFGEVTWKYKINELIDKLHNTLNTLNELMINKDNFPVETIEIIETTIETLKTIKDCANYKDKEVGRNSFDEFHKTTIASDCCLLSTKNQ